MNCAALFKSDNYSVLALLEALLTGMGVSVRTLDPLLVEMGVRDVQKKNGLQISANAKWKGSGYNSKGKHTYTPAFTYILKENKPYHWLKSEAWQPSRKISLNLEPEQI